MQVEHKVSQLCHGENDGPYQDVGQGQGIWYIQLEDQQ